MTAIHSYASRFARLTSLATLALATTALAGPSDLVISEVVEGNGVNYKWIEILNRGATPVTLNDPSNVIQLRRYSNGLAAATAMNLTGTIAPGGRFIIAHNQTDYRGVHGPASDASQYNTGISHNGDDSYDLYNSTTTTIIDGFAKDWVTGADAGTDMAANGTFFRVLSELPNNGNFGNIGGTAAIPDGTVSETGFWHRVAIATTNSNAAAVTTPFAGGGASGVEVPVTMSGFSID